MLAAKTRKAPLFQTGGVPFPGWSGKGYIAARELCEALTEKSGSDKIKRVSFLKEAVK